MGYKLNKTVWLLGLVLAVFVVFDGYLVWRWYQVSGGRRGEVRLDSEVAGYRLESGSESDLDSLPAEVRFAGKGRPVIEMAMVDTILGNEEKRNRRANSLLLYGLHGLVARVCGVLWFW